MALKSIKGIKGINPFDPEGELEVDWDISAEHDEVAEVDPSGRKKWKEKEKQDQIPKADIRFGFMTCQVCSAWARPPTYFCDRGHVYCYRCAAFAENCGGRKCNAKIRLRKMEYYDYRYHKSDPVNCVRAVLGCPRRYLALNLVKHAQHDCIYRIGIDCPIKDCISDSKKSIFWGFIDEHMTKFHGCAKKKITSRCSGLTFQTFYAKDGATVTPVLFDKANTRKFILAITQESGFMKFLVYTLKDGYSHGNQKFSVTIIVRTSDNKPTYILEENINSSWKEGQPNIDTSKPLKIDQNEFEMNCLLFDAKDNPYFMTDFFIIKTEGHDEENGAEAVEKKEKKQEKQPISESEDLEPIKNLKKCDIILPKHKIKSKFELPEKVVATRNVAKEREEAELARRYAEYEERLKRPPVSPYTVDLEYIRQTFPDRTLTPAQEREKRSVSLARTLEVKTGQLTSAEIPKLERNFKWTTADTVLLDRTGRNAFDILPTVTRGIYYLKFLRYEMEAYFSEKQEKAVMFSRGRVRGSFRK